MSAKKDTYIELKKQLETIENVKTVRLFNSQFLPSPNESTFALPAVMVEFAQLSYTAKAKGLQEADTLLRLHVAFHSLETEDLDVLDLLDEIQFSLQGFVSSAPHGPLNRTAELQDINHDQVSVWVMEYTTLITDVAGCWDKRLIETTLTELEIIRKAAKPWLLHL